MNNEVFREEGKKLASILYDMGLYREIVYEEPDLEDLKETTATSYPIKAFEKFLGFYDNKEKIAFNPSISFNTDFSYCISSCRYTSEEGKDFVSLDNEINATYASKAEKALEYFRKRFGIKGSFQFNIKRFRRYDTAKGMSESSAVAAAVALSLINNVFPGMKEKPAVASRFARLVSDSGTRACINGLSMWLSYPGINTDQSFAFKLRDNPMNFHYGIFPKKRGIPTDRAHETAVKSIFYESWIKDKYNAIKKGIENNFNESFLLERGQEDSLNLHSVLLSGELLIQTPESIELIGKILDFQKKNDELYLNADTGPSIMIASREKSIINEFREEVSDYFLEGSFGFHGHESREAKFKKESSEFFSNV